MKGVALWTHREFSTLELSFDLWSCLASSTLFSATEGNCSTHRMLPAQQKIAQSKHFSYLAQQLSWSRESCAITNHMKIHLVRLQSMLVGPTRCVRHRKGQLIVQKTTMATPEEVSVLHWHQLYQNWRVFLCWKKIKEWHWQLFSMPRMFFSLLKTCFGKSLIDRWYIQSPATFF